MKQKYAWAAALLWSLAIFIAISIPGGSLPEGPDWGVDKVVHFTLFLVFSLLWLQAGSNRYLPYWVLLGGLLYAVTTEYYQGLLPVARSPDPLDVVANTAGILTGVVSYWCWQRYQPRKSKN